MTGNRSPKPWGHINLPKNITEKVLYLPISDPKLSNIEIIENHEPLVDLVEVDNPRLVPLAEFDAKYQNTYIGWSRVRAGLRKKLESMLKILPENIGIAYFEGFRTLEKQKQYFDEKLIETLQTIPDPYEAYQETTKSVSPFIDNIPTHATGAAIDMTLFSTEGDEKELLDMGMFDVIFGPNNQQETFSQNTSELQKQNRIKLLEAATEAGLVNYGYEWWHYSFGDKAYAYVTGQRAIYGLAEDPTNPILAMDKEQYLEEITSIVNNIEV